MSDAGEVATAPAPEHTDQAADGSGGGEASGRVAAAEARRRRVLSRGTDRLKQITGEYARAEERDEGAATDLARQDEVLEVPASAGEEQQPTREAGPRGLGGALPLRQQPSEVRQRPAASARENEALRQRQQRWMAGAGGPFGDLSGFPGLGTPPAAAGSMQLGTAQVVPLALEASQAVRVLLSAVFAQLSFQLYGRPRPASQFLLPAWAAVNALPPVLGLLATLLLVTASTTLLLQRSPAKLRRLAEQQPQSGVLKWLGPLAPLAALLPGLRQALARFAAAAGLLRAFLDCLAVYLVTLVLARTLVAPQ